MGWPLDAFTMEPVIDGTRAELLTLDSTVIATATPTWNPRYRPNSYFDLKVKERSGTFILRVTNPKYTTYTKTVKYYMGKMERSYSLGYIKLRRAPQTQTLGEAVVTATKIKFYTKGDTLIYNADAFNLAEGSMLDALVSQLPGAQLQRDGRILVNGKQVESILLNGKDFFKNDHTILLDNLPAYTVQNIKFYHKQSDFHASLQQQTGHTLEDGRFVMDVVLKREYQIGWLNNMEVGGGTHDRWLARLFALRFTPQSRLTFFANANNTHETRKPGDNGDWSPAELGNGTSTTRTGGFDYNVEDKLDRWVLDGNIQASHSDTRNETRQSRDRFQSDGNVYTRSSYVGNNGSTSVSTNHQYRFNLGPERNRHSSELHLSPSFQWQRNKSVNESLLAEFSSNPASWEDWESVFLGNASAAMTSALVNRVKTAAQSRTTHTAGGATANYSRKIPHTPYSIMTDVGLNASHDKSNTFDLYQLWYDTGNSDDYRRRYYHRPSDHRDAHAGVSLSTPFDREWVWVATSTIRYDYLHDKQENSLYRLDRLTELNDSSLTLLPSTRDALLRTLDTLNSYFTEDTQHKLSVSFNGRYDNHIYRNGNKYARFRFTWKLGLALQEEQWHYTGSVQTSTHRTSWLPSAGLEVLRNTPGMKHELELQTSYRQQLPSLFTLMDLSYDSDPLNLRSGNPGLHRTEKFEAVFYYRSGKWHPGKGRQLQGNARLNISRNAVSTSQIYDASTGVRTYRPENVNGNWDANAWVELFGPLGQKGFSLTTSIYEVFYHSVDLTGGDSQTPVRSTVQTNYLSFPFQVDYSRGKVSVGVKTSLTWCHVMSHRSNFRPVDVAQVNVGVNGHFTLPWSLHLSTDFTCFTRGGYSNKAMNTTDYVWNAQLSKSVLHGALTFSVVGYDILGQLSNISYTFNSQGMTETWRNVIPRYAMLRVMYRFNKQPKKER